MTLKDLLNRVNEEDIDNLDSRGIYGATSFWCDYYNLDEELYWQKNQGECAANV